MKTGKTSIDIVVEASTAENVQTATKRPSSLHVKHLPIFLDCVLFVLLASGNVVSCRAF